MMINNYSYIGELTSPIDLNTLEGSEKIGIYEINDSNMMKAFHLNFPDVRDYYTLKFSGGTYDRHWDDIVYTGMATAYGIPYLFTAKFVREYQGDPTKMTYDDILREVRDISSQLTNDGRLKYNELTSEQKGWTDYNVWCGIYGFIGFDGVGTDNATIENPPLESRMKYEYVWKFFLSYLSYTQDDLNFLSGILEVIAEDNITYQRLTRFPDGGTFTRKYENNQWTNWEMEISTFDDLTNRFTSYYIKPKKFMTSESITSHINRNILPFNDKPLRDRIATKINRENYDKLVWADRPDEMRGITVFDNIYTYKMNVIPSSSGHFHISGKVKDSYGNATYMHYTYSDKILRLGMYSNKISNYLRFRGGPNVANGARLYLYKNNQWQRALTKKEVSFNSQGYAGNSTIVLPDTPKYDIHVYYENAVYHFIPGVASQQNFSGNMFFDDANKSPNDWFHYERGDNFIDHNTFMNSGRWNRLGIYYDGNRTITARNNKNVTSGSVHVLWR